MHQQAVSTVTPPTTQAEHFKRSFIRLNTEKTTRITDRQRPLLSKAQSMAVSGFIANHINPNSSQEAFLTNNLSKQQSNIDSAEECNGKFIILQLRCFYFVKSLFRKLTTVFRRIDRFKRFKLLTFFLDDKS